MNERPLSLTASLREIWRRRVLVLVVAVLCGLGGVAFGLLKPHDSTAVALVLLPPSAASTSGTPANDPHTDAVIANSTPVLTAAGVKVSPPVGVAKLRTLVTVKAISGQILQVQARAPQAGYAEQLADAVASSYVTYTGQLASASAGSQVAALQQQSAQLTKQIDDLQTQIGTVSARIGAEASGSSAGLQDANLLSSLQSEQSQLSQQLNGVNAQISAAQIASSSTANTTRILQTAAAVPADVNGFTVTAGIVGFIIGVLGSSVFVLLGSQRDGRLRLRDEIAQAAGAPVMASLEAHSCTTPTAWRELFETPAAGDDRVGPPQPVAYPREGWRSDEGRTRDFLRRRHPCSQHWSTIGVACRIVWNDDGPHARYSRNARGSFPRHASSSIHRGRASRSRIAFHCRAGRHGSRCAQCSSSPWSSSMANR